MRAAIAVVVGVAAVAAALLLAGAPRSRPLASAPVRVDAVPFLGASGPLLREDELGAPPEEPLPYVETVARKPCGCCVDVVAPEPPPAPSLFDPPPAESPFAPARRHDPSEAVRRGLFFLERERRDGRWGDARSTALALLAFAASGRATADLAREALRDGPAADDVANAIAIVALAKMSDGRLAEVQGHHVAAIVSSVQARRAPPWADAPDFGPGSTVRATWLALALEMSDRRVELFDVARVFPEWVRPRGGTHEQLVRRLAARRLHGTIERTPLGRWLARPDGGGGFTMDELEAFQFRGGPQRGTWMGASLEEHAYRVLLLMGA